jgi:hypothetical protein
MEDPRLAADSSIAIRPIRGREQPIILSRPEASKRIVDRKILCEHPSNLGCESEVGVKRAHHRPSSLRTMLRRTEFIPSLGAAQNAGNGMNSVLRTAPRLETAQSRRGDVLCVGRNLFRHLGPHKMRVTE